MDNKTGVLMGKYEIGRILGQGTFAKVHYARSLVNNQSVAIKVIDKEKVMRVGMMDQIKREISIMRMIRHPNVVHLFEVLATKTKIYFIMEHAKGGELFDKVAKGRLKEAVAQKYFIQLISAVDFCHSRGVYHRDIKPENLLLDENENLKVTDFGLSALAESKRQDGLLHTTCGTPAYVAPEVIQQNGYDGSKADIWSCGVVLYVLLAGYLPFRDSNIMELYRKIEKADFKFPSSFSREVRRLLVRILDPNPETRISIFKIKESTWIKKDLTSKSHESGLHMDGNPGPSGSTSTNLDEIQQDLIRPAEVNAFDIISLSCGFDLSGLFEPRDPKKEARFTSRQPAPILISRLIELAKRLCLNVRQMDKGLLNFERIKGGKKGAMSIDTEIFELTPELFLVEMRKSNGDTVEYQKLLKEDIRPALQDIVWAWQGEKAQQHAQQKMEQTLPQQQNGEQLQVLEQ